MKDSSLCLGGGQSRKLASRLADCLKGFGTGGERLLQVKFEVSFPLFGWFHADPVYVGQGLLQSVSVWGWSAAPMGVRYQIQKSHRFLHDT